jgi:hypothetical protein
MITVTMLPGWWDQLSKLYDRTSDQLSLVEVRATSTGHR